MNSTLPSVLKQLERMLYGKNYQVFLRSYNVFHPPDANCQEILCLALSNEALQGDTCQVTIDKAVASISGCLEYSGDEHHGPKFARLQSSKFDKLRVELVELVRQQCRSSISVTGFWLAEGHPAYPVYWDFAFLFRGNETSTILIGSSSD